MAYSIREVRPDDAPVLAYIQTESWKAAFPSILTEQVLRAAVEPASVEAMYREILDEKIGNGLVMEVDGTPHAIGWWSESRDADSPGYAEIICIHSLPDRWGRGYGGVMMDRLLADIRQAGYRKVMLWVFRDNLRARGFYERKGFSFNGKVQSAFGTDEVCYERELPRMRNKKEYKTE